MIQDRRPNVRQSPPNLDKVMRVDERTRQTTKTKTKVTAIKDNSDKHIDINN